MTFSNFNSNCFIFLDLRNLWEQAKKPFCYQKLFWLLTVWINCSGDLNFANSQPSTSNFKSFSWSLEQSFLIVRQNNFGNKIPFLSFSCLAHLCFSQLRQTQFEVSMHFIYKFHNIFSCKPSWTIYLLWRAEFYQTFYANRALFFVNKNPLLYTIT